MIISNTNKYIFVAIPKTATHAVRFALRQHLDEEKDWEHVSKYITRRIPIKELSTIQHGHLRCIDIKPHLDVLVWDSYFKFAICRNPYDRFVSSCRFLYRRSEEFNKDPKGGMRSIIENDSEMSRVLLRPQSDFICDADGSLMVDYLGRYEELDDSYRRICSLAGIPYSQLGSVNVTGHDTRAEHLDAGLKEAVRRRYRMDFDVLGYSR